MITRDLGELKLSMLGFGAMRLPVIDGDDNNIDREETFRMVDAAMAAGINYYDTAWGYHGGNSETAYAKKREEHNRKANQEQYRRERERQLLTPGLRYDILKRDNFRCQICGRTARDGVTLEVDHKKPIARGGKTEPNNLWTLCWDCNRGKADKL